MIKKQNELAFSNKKIKSFEEKITSLNQEVSIYKDKCNGLETKNQVMNEEIMKKNDKISELEKKVRDYEYKCSELILKNEETKTKVQNLELENENLKKEISDKDDQIGLCKFNEELNQTQLETLEKQFKNEQDNNKQLTIDIETLRELIKEKELSLTISQQKIQELNETIKSLKKRIDRIEKLIS